MGLIVGVLCFIMVAIGVVWLGYTLFIWVTMGIWFAVAAFAAGIGRLPCLRHNERRSP